MSGTSEPDTVQDVYGPRLLSGVYDLHRGVDFAATLGQPIHTVEAGKVVRIETSSQTLGTARERFGNWVLIEHAPLADGTPVHTGYLHLDTISVAEGDTLQAGGLIGGAGSSGVNISTVHLHLDAYYGLTGTSLDRDKLVNPFRMLPVKHQDEMTLSVLASRCFEVQFPAPEVDLTRIDVIGRRARATLNLESEDGLCGDAAHCGVFSIAPSDFEAGDTRATWTVHTNTLGPLLEIAVYDVRGRIGDWSAIRDGRPPRGVRLGAQRCSASPVALRRRGRQLR